MFKHVLVATDGSELADRALELAMGLGVDTRVTALMVVPDYGMAAYTRMTFGTGLDVEGLRRRIVEAGEAELGAALARVRPNSPLRPGRVESRVLIGDLPYQTIIDTAEQEGCDLIVMASRGRGGLASAFLGSQTLRVLALTKVPVLVAR
jgi:nucleotide-binding universal stress UspA family protein